MWPFKKQDHRIRTYTGKLVDPFNLKVEDVDLFDIAHANSQQARFTGHTLIHFSICQHSLLVAHLCPAGFKFDGLNHDDDEAYGNDMASPVKKHWTMRGYKKYEKKRQRVISQVFGTRYPIPEEVHECDKYALHIEQFLFMKKENGPYPEPVFESSMKPSGTIKTFTYSKGIDFARKLSELSMKQVEQLFIDSFFLFKGQEGLE